MTFRFHSTLLTSVMLVLLGACTTTAPVPVETTPEVEDQASVTETRRPAEFDLQYEIQIRRCRQRDQHMRCSRHLWICY